jgi:hypothetical protein
MIPFGSCLSLKLLSPDLIVEVWIFVQSRDGVAMVILHVSEEGIVIGVNSLLLMFADWASKSSTPRLSLNVLEIAFIHL